MVCAVPDCYRDQSVALTFGSLQKTRREPGFLLALSAAPTQRT
jgi:hypothetical protein